MPIRMLSLLLCFQSFLACQGLVKLPISKADLDDPSSGVNQQGPEKPRPEAVNIVFQSVDGGQHWKDISAGLPEFLEVGSVIASEDEVFLGSESGLYRCVNASEAPVWESAVSLDKKITDIFPGQAGPYVASYGNGFFKEILGTGVWIPMHNALYDKTIRSILEMPNGSIFIGCESGIFKSADHGKTWKQVFAEGCVWSISAMDGVMIGGAFRGILRSTDGGEHWDWVLTEGGVAFKTGIIEGGLAAITFDGGAAKRLSTSVDGGQTWQQLADDHPTVQFSYDIKRLGEYLFYSDDAGVFRSSNQGKTWQLVFPTHGRQVFDIAVSGKSIFAIRLNGC